jgi:hypothetical protein
MQDAVSRYCDATESGQMDALSSTLAADVELPSPLFGRMVFKGRDDVTAVLSAVYGLLEGVRWDEPIGDGAHRVVVSHAKVGPLRIGDAMLFELDEQGLIRRIRPHLRPWLATSLFALLVGPKVARRPGIVWRALTGPSPI